MENTWLKKFMMFFVVISAAAVLFLRADNSLAISNWKTNPAQCPLNDFTNYPAQNCDPNNICGVNGTGNLECYNTSFAAPVSATSSESYFGSITSGGYVVDCYAYDSAAPYCNNGGSFWCTASSTCRDTQFRTTTCVGSKWASEGGATTCGDCRSGYLDCNGDSGICEIQTGVTASSTHPNTKYASCTTLVCSTGYSDCSGGGDGTGNDANGCEIQNNATISTTIYTGLTCTYNSSCTCVLATSQFTTGINSQFSTTSPLLWGTQYGTGDLLRLTQNTASTTAVFVVDNTGKVAIGTNTTSPSYNLMVSVTMFAVTGTFTNLTVTGIVSVTGATTLATTTVSQITVNNGIQFADGVPTNFSTALYRSGSNLFWGSLQLGSGGGGNASWVTTTAFAASGLSPSGTPAVGLGSDGNDVWVFTSSSIVPRLIVKQDGSVGIGTSTPSQKLEINGNMLVSGNATTTGNFYSQVLNAVTAVLTNLGFTNATGTNLTVANLIATSSATLSNATTTGNLAVQGNTNLATTTISSSTITQANVTTLVVNNSITLNGDTRASWPTSTAISNVRTTTINFQGNFATSSLQGYAAANYICSSILSNTSHMCEFSEIAYFIRSQSTTTISGYSYFGWVANGPPGYVTVQTNDCAGWSTSSSVAYGAWWDFSPSTGGGKGKMTSCNSNIPILCCW